MPVVMSQMIRRQSNGTSRYRGSSHGRRLLGLALWKRLCLLIAFPAIGLCMINAYIAQLDEEYQRRNPFVRYEHVYKHDRRLVWGNGLELLFHNSHNNALPDNYEDEQ